jgi:quercetin dioxygenase-like cupin family protein
MPDTKSAPPEREDSSSVNPDRLDGTRDDSDAGTEGGTKVCFFDSEARLASFFEKHPDRDQGMSYLVNSPTLTITRARYRPNLKVPPHHHNAHQVTFVLKGELHYGAKTVSAGMGVYTPSTKYSFTAGPEGAEVMEIFDAVPTRAVKDNES